jgi:signal transduction histidine kinase
VQAALLLFCLIGPIGGFVGGFGTARSMHRSITRMMVLVRDVHAQLDEEVGLLEVEPAPSLATLDERLEKFLERVREVTHQMQRQQQEILRSEQLAAVGQLAAAVAHEIRNPLTGIKLLVEAAIRQPTRQGLTADDLTLIQRELVRLERTVQSLLDYARPPALRATYQDLRPTLKQAVDLVRSRAAQAGAEIRADLEGEPTCVWHDRDQIAAVLTNLLLNALDATRQGGVVRLGLERGRRGGAVIRVRDNGPGLSPAILPRLFTPFASTKPTGTGLGLSLSQRIARQHGGNLTAANDPAGGACFTLTLTEKGPGGDDSQSADRGR